MSGTSVDAFPLWEKWLSNVANAEGVSFTSGHQIDILVDASEFMPRMLESIRKSESSVTYQFFGIEADGGGRPFGEALIHAARRGVSTKVMLDAVELFIRTNGEWSFLPFQPEAIRTERKETKKMLREMEQAGVDLFRYGWKYLLRRHHAKTLILDNELLYIGGFNPTEHNCVWHEVCAVAHGSIALEAQKTFNEVFVWSGKPAAALSPVGNKQEVRQGVEAKALLLSNCPTRKKYALTHFLETVMAEAKTSIRIQNGYITSRRILEELIRAKQRGVETVQIITPQKSNHSSVDYAFRRWIPKLVKAGVEVYIYPGMTHAKVMSIDDMLVSVGSANLESFSLKFQNETNLIAIDPQGLLARRLNEKMFFPDIEKSARARLQGASVVYDSPVNQAEKATA